MAGVQDFDGARLEPETSYGTQPELKRPRHEGRSQRQIAYRHNGRPHREDVREHTARPEHQLRRHGRARLDDVIILPRRRRCPGVWQLGSGGSTTSSLASVLSSLAHDEHKAARWHAQTERRHRGQASISITARRPIITEHQRGSGREGHGQDLP